MVRFFKAFIATPLIFTGLFMASPCPVAKAQGVDVRCRAASCKVRPIEDTIEYHTPFIEENYIRAKAWFKLLGFDDAKIMTDPHTGDAIIGVFQEGDGECPANAPGCYSPSTQEYWIDIGFFSGAGAASAIGPVENMAEIISHELFHSIQSYKRDPRIASDYKKGIDWLVEGTAEAAGRAYVYYEARNAALLELSDKQWDAPLTFEGGAEEYSLGAFFLWLGEKLDSSQRIAYLRHFRNFDTDERGLPWFDRHLRAVGAADFKDLLPDYVASELNTIYGYFATNKAGRIRPPFDNTSRTEPFHEIGLTQRFNTPVRFSGEAVSVAEIDFEVLELSARPDFLVADYKSVSSEDRDRLRVVRIEVSDADRISDLTLVHEDKVAGRARDDAAILLLISADQTVDLGLTRITNASYPSSESIRQTGKIRLVDERAAIESKTCAEPRERIDIQIAARSSGYHLDDFLNAAHVELRPSAGRMLDGQTFEAPSQEGTVSFDIKFEDFVRSDDSYENGPAPARWLRKIHQIRVGADCGARITVSSGETYTWDARKDLSEVRARGGTLLLLKEPMAYLFEPQEGWCAIDIEAMSAMFLGRATAFAGSGRKKLVDSLGHAASELDRAGRAIGVGESSGQIREGAKRIAGTDADTRDFASLAEAKRKFDFYRLPKALNTMFSLSNLRNAANEQKKHRPRSADVASITLSRAPCRDGDGRTCAKVDMKGGGEKISLFYDKQNRLSKITAGRDSMTIDYGGYEVRSAPVNARSCMQ